MPSRAFVVVGGGSSSRFGAEKLLADVAGTPLIQMTLDALRPHVDTCVLVGRDDMMTTLQSLDMGCDVVVGGSTRTESEIAGLEAVGTNHELIGIHDAARPLVSTRLVDELFEQAAVVGGAIPAMGTERLIITRAGLVAQADVVAVQTPQVFRAEPLRAAYAAANAEGYVGADTAEIIEKFSALPVAVVPGEPTNIKVTYPEDLEAVRALS